MTLHALDDANRSFYTVMTCQILIGRLMSGDSMAEALKNSPHNGRGTPRDDIPPGGTPNDMVPYNLQYQDNVSRRDRAAI